MIFLLPLAMLLLMKYAYFMQFFCSFQQYIKEAQSLPNYNAVVLPHCLSDARKSGHIIMAVGTDGFTLRACTEEGELEVGGRERERPILFLNPQTQEHNFPWSMVPSYEADLEDCAFVFKVTREGKEPRWIRVYTPYVSLPPFYDMICY